MLNLDRHIFVFAVSGERRPAEQDLLARNRWSISARDVTLKQSRTANPGKNDDYVNPTGQFQELCR